MKINRKEKIAGIPILNIRDFLKKYKLFDENLISEILNVNDSQTSKIISDLQTAGYIIKDSQHSHLYKATLLGTQLSLAKAIPPIDRKKADELFNSFMKRVLEVNSNPYYLYKVNEVNLFGSYITDSSTVNDIDIAVELTPKESNEEIFWESHEKRIEDAIDAGRTFRNLSDELGYPENEVFFYLKAKERYLSIHSNRDGILKLTAVKKVIF